MNQIPFCIVRRPGDMRLLFAGQNLVLETDAIGGDVEYGDVLSAGDEDGELYPPEPIPCIAKHPGTP